MRSRILRFLLRFAAASLLLFGVAGCGAALETETAQMRVVHASAYAGTLDVLSKGNGSATTGVAYNLSFGTVTTYFPTTASTYTAASSDTHMEIANAHIDAAKAKHYTLLVEDTSGGVTAKVLMDQNQPAPAGHASLRFANEMLDNGALDLYLVPLDKASSRTVIVASALKTGTNIGYTAVPAGTYMLYVMPTGMALHANLPLYVGAAVTYASGAVRTLVLLNQASSRQSATSVLTLRDADSSAATE